MRWFKSQNRPAAETSHSLETLPADIVGRLVGTLERLEQWMAEWGDDAARWSAFDRFVRNEIHALTGGEQVRCYHVLEDAEALESLVPSEGLVPARMAIEGSPYADVVWTSRTIRPKDAAARDHASDTPVWCFPITREGEIIGLVSVGRLFSPNEHYTSAWLQAVELLICNAWTQLCDRERLMSAWQTDAGTGVLTRTNFFRAAETALTQGTIENEPAVLLSVALEGIRRLDDAGCWTQRDDVLNTVGSVMHARLRSDDVIGRFSDDRFVALLRRIDRPLAGLISTHLLEALEKALEAVLDEHAPVRVRASIAGPAEKDWTLNQLLEAGLNAVRQARSDERAIVFVTSPLAPVEAMGDH